MKTSSILLVLVSGAVFPAQAAAPDLDKLKSQCNAADFRACRQLEQAALRNKNLQIRLGAIARIDDVKILDQIANEARLDSTTRQAASDRSQKIRQDRQDSVWREVRRSSNLAAYEQFARDYPQSTHREEIDWVTLYAKNDDLFSYDDYLEEVRNGAYQGTFKSEAERRRRELMPSTSLTAAEVTDLARRVNNLLSPFSLDGLCQENIAAALKQKQSGAYFSYNKAFVGGAEKTITGDTVQVKTTGGATVKLVKALSAAKGEIPFKSLILFDTNGRLDARYIVIDGRWYKWR